jgi:hypothetical protein
MCLSDHLTREVGIRGDEMFTEIQDFPEEKESAIVQAGGRGGQPKDVSQK